MRNKVCIIGSASFIAGYVIRVLHEQGCLVIGLQRHGFTEQMDIFDQSLPDEFYCGDITNSEIVSRVVSVSDGVINLAGRLGTSEEVNNPFPAVEVNIKGTLNVLEACRTWKKPFVQIAVGNHWMDNTYSITRTTAERFTRMYVKEHGIEANVVRALNAWGEKQSYFSYKKMMPAFILSALNNKPLSVNGNGEQLMDFIYCSDLARFLVMVLLDPFKANELSVEMIAKCNAQDRVDKDVFNGLPYGNTYQCGAGFGRTVNELAELVIKCSESKSLIKHVPMRAGEVSNSKIVADYTSPTYKYNLEDKLPDVIRYYKKNLDRYTI